MVVAPELLSSLLFTLSIVQSPTNLEFLTVDFSIGEHITHRRGELVRVKLNKAESRAGCNDALLLNVLHTNLQMVLHLITYLIRRRERSVDRWGDFIAGQSRGNISNIEGSLVLCRFYSPSKDVLRTYPFGTCSHEYIIRANASAETVLSFYWINRWNAQIQH